MTQRPVVLSSLPGARYELLAPVELQVMIWPDNQRSVQHPTFGCGVGKNLGEAIEDFKQDLVAIYTTGSADSRTARQRRRSET